MTSIHDIIRLHELGLGEAPTVFLWHLDWAQINPYEEVSGQYGYSRYSTVEADRVQSLRAASSYILDSELSADRLAAPEPPKRIALLTDSTMRLKSFDIYSTDFGHIEQTVLNLKKSAHSPEIKASLLDLCWRAVLSFDCRPADRSFGVHGEPHIIVCTDNHTAILSETLVVHGVYPTRKHTQFEMSRLPAGIRARLRQPGWDE